MLEKSKLKYIQSLGHKKYRDVEGLFVAEGPKLIAELAEENVPIEHIYAVEEWIRTNPAISRKFPCTAIAPHQLEAISGQRTPNQVLALVKQFPETAPLPEGGLLLALDGIRDPGNLGTLIRTADWFGVKQVVCSPDCAELYNPKVVQSTMGSIARMNICYTDFAEWLPKRKMRLYAAVMKGKNFIDLNPVKEGILLIGNEAHGISENLLAMADERITIPGRGKAESLNAAVAAGILIAKLLN